MTASVTPKGATTGGALANRSTSSKGSKATSAAYPVAKEPSRQQHGPSPARTTPTNQQQTNCQDQVPLLDGTARSVVSALTECRMCETCYHRWILDVNGEVYCGNCGCRPHYKDRELIKQYAMDRQQERIDEGDAHDVDKAEG